MDTAMIALAALIGVGIALTFVARRSQRPALAVRAVVSGLLGINGLGLLVCAVMFGVLLGAPLPALAQEGIAPEGASSGVALGAALATGLACIGAGIAVGIAGAAAIGGITEKPEILGRTLIFVGLAEGIAIYGLIVSFIILNA
ncbi:MAG: ATPase [Chloroflexi bacterium]|nr:ATPase [Chloroflexota bacterium]